MIPSGLQLDDEVGAVAVLDQQVRRWTRHERERVEQARAEVRDALEAPDRRPPSAPV